MKIADVRVFDGQRVLPHQDIVVEDGVITEVTEAAATSAAVGGRGRTVLPGLFDAHLHLPPHPEGALRQLAGMGVTTALDMFSGGETLAGMVRLRQTDPPQFAALRTAGTGAVAPGSMLEKLAGHPLPSVDGPAAADAWVAARVQEGADYIKIIYDERQGGPLGLATVAALVDAAHARGLLAVAHTVAEQPARQAIGAGVDGLVHLFIGAAAGEDFGRFAADHGVFVVPTLIVLRAVCGYRPDEELLTDRRVADLVSRSRPPFPVRPADPSRHHLYTGTTTALRQLAAAGVPVLAGTDTAPPTAALGVFGYGATLHAELDLLVQAGLSPIQALVAATSAPASAFRFSDRGFVRPGMRADLVLVNGDPTEEIRDTRNIVSVWKRGVRVDRAGPGDSPAGPANRS